jgi:hypothetical protein
VPTTEVFTCSEKGKEDLKEEGPEGSKERKGKEERGWGAPKECGLYNEDSGVHRGV